MWAKLESANPGGSLKDRAGLWMVIAAEDDGRIRPNSTVLEATSGNTGVALALVSAVRGHRLTLVMPDRLSLERKRVARAFGAELVLTDPLEGTDGAIREARRLAAAERDRYVYLDQYSNPANVRAHYEGTAVEILAQTSGRLTHFVAGLGTSGTFMGVTRRLKEYNPAIQCATMQPDGPLHGLEGLKHMETAIRPGIYDASIADEQIEIATEEAQQMVLRLAREEGYLVGVSAGANLVAALKIAARLKEGVVVTIFCDSAAKYLSESFWQDLQSEAENWP